MPLAAAEFWERKEYPTWSKNEVDKMLTDSPWAQSFDISFRLDPFERGPETWKDISLTKDRSTIEGGSPVGGIGVPPRGAKAEAYMVIRWSSALPVRQAVVIDRFGVEGLRSPEAREILDETPEFYVVEIFGVPAIVAYQGAQVIQDEIHRTAALVTHSGRALRPESVYVPVHGEHLSITARFPRTVPLTLEDKQVDFQGRGGPFEFHQRFKLKSMMYEGRLEL